jgi:anti-sigma factor RsiW
MNCRAFVKSLSDWQAGELTGAQIARREEHLEHCAKCTAYVRSLMVTRELVRRVSDYHRDDAPFPPELRRQLIRWWHSHER